MFASSPAFIGLVVTYFGILVGISVWSGMKTKGLTDYLTASRSIGPVVGGASLAATQMSAGTFVGTLGIHYLTGASFVWLWPGLWLGWLVQALWVAPKFAQFGGKTVPEYVRARYGSTAASHIAALLILVAYTVYLTAQYQAGGAIFQVLFGMPFLYGVLITIGVTLLFVIVGGMRATAYTDLLDALIMAGCFLAAIPVVLMHLPADQIGGIASGFDPALTGWFYGPKDLIGFALAFGLSMATAPYELARLYTMRDVKTVRLAIGWSFVFQAVVGLSVAFLGVATRSVFPFLPNPDTASSVLSVEMLPPLVGGLVLIAVIGAISSTVSGIMIVSASALTHDLLGDVLRVSDRAQLWLTRLAVLALGCIPVFLALQQLDLVQFVVLLQASLVASFFFATVVIGLNWRGATATGAIASMLVGFGVALGWELIGKPYEIDAVVPGVLTSVATFFVVSRLTPPPAAEHIGLFFPEQKMQARAYATATAPDSAG
ncbi:MAG: sodium:solute symporter family protein [Carbonactinosporaceae bacterium]